MQSSKINFTLDQHNRLSLMRFQTVRERIKSSCNHSKHFGLVVGYLCRIFSSSVRSCSTPFSYWPALLLERESTCLSSPGFSSLANLSLSVSPSLSLSLSSSCSRHFLPAVCFSSPLPRSPGFCPGHVSYSPIFYSLPPAISLSLSLSLPPHFSPLPRFAHFRYSSPRLFLLHRVFTTRCLVSHVRPCVSPVFTKVSPRVPFSQLSPLSRTVFSLLFYPYAGRKEVVLLIY